jgi:hypothetical protein
MQRTQHTQHTQACSEARYAYDKARLNVTAASTRNDEAINNEIAIRINIANRIRSTYVLSNQPVLTPELYSAIKASAVAAYMVAVAKSNANVAFRVWKTAHSNCATTTKGCEIMKARVIAHLTNADKTKCCCKCGSRAKLRVVESDLYAIGCFKQTQTKAYCWRCSERLLSDSTGDPRI